MTMYQRSFLDSDIISSAKLIKGSESITPNFYRMITDFNKILQNRCFINEEKCDRISNIINSLLVELKEAEDTYYKYYGLEIETSEIIRKQIMEEHVVIDKLVYPVPDMILQMLFRRFFIHLTIAQRYTVKIVKVIFDDEKMMEGSYRRNKLSEYLKEKEWVIGVELKKQYDQMLKDDAKELEYFSKIRNKIEHVENHEMLITNFSYSINNKQFIIEKPKYESEYCDILMKFAFEYVYTFIEDFISMILNLCSDGEVIVQKHASNEAVSIIDDYILDIGNIEYRVGLKPEQASKYLKEFDTLSESS